MKRHTGGRTIDGISVLVDGEPLSPHADQLKLTDYGSNGAMRAPSLRSWPSRSCSSIRQRRGGKEPLSELHAADRRQFRTTRKMTSADIDAAIVALRGERAA